MARRPERNHEAYNGSGLLKKKKVLIIQLQYGRIMANFDRGLTHTHT